MSANLREGCVFCRPDNRNEWGEPMYRLAPLNPVVPGHMLFIPSAHVQHASVDPVMTGRLFGYAARYAAEQCQPFNLITSAGSAATQTMFHLHVHYVPRADRDGLHLPWTGQRIFTERYEADA